MTSGSESTLWRYLLAGLLSLLVLMAWTTFVAPPRPAAPPQPAAVPPAARPQSPPEAQPAPQPVTEETPRRPPREAKEATLASAHYSAMLDSRGAEITKLYLPEFSESVEKKEDPYQLLFPIGPGEGPLSIDLEIDGARPLPSGESWETLEERAADGSLAAVVFRNEADGVRVAKRVSQGDPADYPLGGQDGEDGPPRHLKVRLEITNQSTRPIAIAYSIHGPGGIDTEVLQGEGGSDIELAFGQWSGGGDKVYAETLRAASIGGGHWERGERIAWVGVSNNYFASVLYPSGPSGPKSAHIERAFADTYPDRQQMAKLALEKHRRPLLELPAHDVAALAETSFKNLKTGLRVVKHTLKPGEELVHEYGLYTGPRERSILDRYAALDLQGVNQYGMFSILVKFFIFLLGALKSIAFGSWGVAIVLLTVIVKACLHPINRKSQGSMMRFQKKMQRMKPEMDELKARYGDNRLKMNQEMQKLWKKHDVNPAQQMAGCLIIFLQLPIWYGLYSTLQYAIGLRQAPFLYIEDLTRPDMLFSFGYPLPWIGEYFNLLPLLYVILTVVNQRLQPKPEDQQMLAQYKMMTFMLVIFGFIFYSFPAGFMLYIMTSAALGIIESKIIKAELARDPEIGAIASGEAPVPQSTGNSAPYPARQKKGQGASASPSKGKSRSGR